MQATAKQKGDVLVLTIGTGDMDRLEETLFRPLEKSLGTGRWNEAVLLPSALTEANAQELRKRARDFPVWIEPLPEAGQENDADACFSHFDRMLNDLRVAGYAPERIVPDFTRGTKAMSAALVLASIGHGIPQLRYIYGDRDRRGMVLPDQENVGEVKTVRAMMRRRIDDARKLMDKGAYAAVMELLPDIDTSRSPSPAQEEFRKDISRLRHLAAFWSAWDRLDYKEAALCAGKFDQDDAKGLDEMSRLVLALAHRPGQDDHPAMANWLRHVAGDLLANGRRRIVQHQFEDALLRAYRVLELIGQFRLFDHGHDSARIDPENHDVKKLREQLDRKKYENFGKAPNKKGDATFLTAGRMVTARFLDHLGDSFGKELIRFDDDRATLDGGRKEPQAKARMRNKSILIHGFSVAKLDGDSLKELHNRIEALLEKDRIERTDVSRFRSINDFGIIP